jgi:hypothetical protein
MEREHFPFFFAATLFLFAAVLFTSHPFTGTADGGYAAIFYSKNGSSASISSISPSQATYGNSVKITGYNFDKNPIVSFDGNLAVPATIQTKSSLTFIVPPGLATGVHKVRVGAAKDGTPLSNALNLTIKPVTLTFVSNGTETYTIEPATDEKKISGFAVKIPKYKPWATIKDASWISYDAKTSTPGSGPTNGTVGYFFRKFTLPQLVAKASIQIAADDSSSISVNGVEVMAANTVGPFTQCAATGISCTKISTIQLPAELLKVGENEIAFGVNQKKAKDPDSKTPFGLIYSLVVELAPPVDQAPSETYQCNDGVDNDSDGLVDYPSDPGCQSSTGNTEVSTSNN